MDIDLCHGLVKTCKIFYLLTYHRYIESEDSFIFTFDNNEFTMYHVNEPMIAIKQSEYQYSPCFGEVDKSDLFISFKYPQKSYGKKDGFN